MPSSFEVSPSTSPPHDIEQYHHIGAGPISREAAGHGWWPWARRIHHKHHHHAALHGSNHHAALHGLGERAAAHTAAYDSRLAAKHARAAGTPPLLEAGCGFAASPVTPTVHSSGTGGGTVVQLVEHAAGQGSSSAAVHLTNISPSRGSHGASGSPSSVEGVEEAPLKAPVVKKLKRKPFAVLTDTVCAGLMLTMMLALLMLELHKWPANLWAVYCRQLELRPLPTKIVTGLVGCLLGDLLAQVLSHMVLVKHHNKANSKGQQQLQHHQQQQSHAAGMQQQQVLWKGQDVVCVLPPTNPRFQYDAARAARLLLYTLLTTPYLVVWYQMLDRLVMPQTPTAAKAIFLKVELDQALQSPLLCLVFFAFMRGMEDFMGGLPPQQLTLGNVFWRARMAAITKFLPTMRCSYMVWPLAHVVNFAVVPSSQRILYINVVAIFWTAFLSWQASSGGSGLGLKGLAQDVDHAGYELVGMSSDKSKPEHMHAV